jgi:hypothetical protein
VESLEGLGKLCVIITTGTSIGPGKKKYDQIDKKKTCVHHKSVKKTPKKLKNDPL